MTKERRIDMDVKDKTKTNKQKQYKGNVQLSKYEMMHRSDGTTTE